MPILKTENFVLAAYIKYRGFKLLRIDSVNPKKRWIKSFVFDSEHLELGNGVHSEKGGISADEAAQLFLREEASVEPNRFFSAIKSLKEAIKNSGPDEAG